MSRSFRRRSRLRTFIVRGFAALLPTVLTVFLLITGFNLLNQYLGGPVIDFLNWAHGPLTGPDGSPILGADAKPIVWIPAGSWVGPLLTVGISAVACFIVGFFLATIAGGQLYSVVEGWLVGLPVVKKIYPYAKQVTDFFFREKPMEWTAVVALEYPRKGVWSIGFITAESIAELSQKTGGRLVSVYMPTSPVPFTGYVVAVSPDEVVKLSMTVEEAIRWLVSAGVVLPGGEPYKRPILKDPTPPPTLPETSGTPE